jgi:hypothetical protein
MAVTTTADTYTLTVGWSDCPRKRKNEAKSCIDTSIDTKTDRKDEPRFNLTITTRSVYHHRNIFESHRDQSLDPSDLFLAER